MNICFAYNVKHNTNYSVNSIQNDIEFDSIETIRSITKTIKELGHKVILLEADLNAYTKLKKLRNKIDLVFNIAEGLGGDARESQIPLFCEMLGIPYTHSSPTTHAITLNKHFTKTLLRASGVRTPKSFIVNSMKDLYTKKDLSYPLIVKPNKEGSSKGIFNDSVVNNFTQLKKSTNRLLQKFTSQVLVEEYIEGRELTVSLLGNPPQVLPIIEQRFDFLPKGYNRIAGYETKWIYEDSLEDLSKAYYCPANLSNKIYKKVVDTSIKIWNALNVLDCARIDYRLRGEELFFIEINTLPGINPSDKVISYFPLSAKVGGITFKKLVDTIIRSACNRYCLSG